MSVFLRSRNMTHYAPDDIRPFFERPTLRILQRVTLADYAFGIKSQRLGLATRWSCCRHRGVRRYVRGGGLFAYGCAHLICLSRAPGSDTRKICEFGRRSYGYIIVDARSLIMCSGYFGWLISKRKNLSGEQCRGPAALPSQPASFQAQRNILL